MIDIYNKLPSDQNYKMQLDTNDEIEMILAQIKMILGTKPKDVLGQPYFGVDINKYIFSMDYKQEELNKIVQEGILQNIVYDESKYDVIVTVDFGKDHYNGSDYACINITINQRPCLGIIVNQ